MMEVAPGKYMPAIAGDIVQEYGLGKWTKDRDGFYRFVPFKEPMIRMTARVGEILGFHSGGYTTVMRLAKAGFIEMVRVSPNCTMLNLDSWYNHMRRVAEHPGDFWDKDGQNFKTYQQAIG
jgi:hypothetical protein